VLSVFAHVLAYVGAPALVLTLGTFAWRVSRAALLQRAGSAALKHGSKDPHGEAGLEIVKALTTDSEPWYQAILPWRRSDDQP
jgi:hypothetical protein